MKVKVWPNPTNWWRVCWSALMAVSAAAAIVASYIYLRELAIACGWTQWRAALFPISLDVLGIASLALYIRDRDGYAQAVSVLVVVASATGNALAHLYAVTGVQPANVVVVAVGSAPVVVAIVLAHLWAHERKDADGDPDGAQLDESANRGAGDRVDARADARDGGMAQRPGNGAAKSSPRAKTRATARTPSAGDLERAQRVRDNQWETVTIPELQGLLGCSYVPAQRARALAKNGAQSE